MPLVCLGLSHKTAPVDVRERHAFPPSRMGESLVALRDYEMVHEAVMLSTCGRLEIYAEIGDYEAGVDQLRRFLRNFRHGDVAHDMSSYMYTLLGSQAAEHLLRVATGLDSMLIGEAEILGQVKDAYVQAQKADSLGKTLHALFREALAAGKEARSRTSIGDDSVSVATAAIELAKERLGSLAGKTVAVVGAGKMGTLAAKRLRLEGCRRLLVVNRSHRKGARHRRGPRQRNRRRIARPHRRAAPSRHRHHVDWSGAVGDQACRRRAKRCSRRPGRSLFIVDVAVPRDVDPDVAQHPGRRSSRHRCARSVVDLTLERRQQAIPLVEEIIAEHVRALRRRGINRASPSRSLVHS